MRLTVMRIPLSVLLILCFLTTALAQRVDFNPKPEEVGRIFFFSSSAPITSAINRVAPTVAEHVEVIINQIDYVEGQIRTSLASEKLVRADGKSPLCTVTDRSLNNSIFRYFGLRGLPDPDRACITQVRGEGDSFSENAPHNVNVFFNAIAERGAILNLKMRRIASRFINVRRNFTGAETPHAFRYNTESAQCVLHSVCGVRVGSEWRLATPIHNRPKYDNLPDFGRQVLNEYSRHNKGRLGDVLRVRVEVPRPSRNSPNSSTRASTYIRSAAGIADPNCFLPAQISENPAMVDALIKVDQDLTKAEDAFKPSTIAILVFPLGFNLIPIRLLAEVSRNWMLYYMLLTDVLTGIPLLIKGIELLSMHKNPNWAYAMRITAAQNGSRSDSAAAEVWAADCRPPDRLRNAGIAFVVVAVVFIIGGMLAEFIAAKYATEHKTRAIEASYAGTGRLLGVWSERDGTVKPTRETGKTEAEAEATSTPLLGNENRVRFKE